ncbi:MAG TPA: response regulator [Flavobacterium sp.]|jgi:DNA-binding NarL/FixJ family response regulator
MFTKILIAEDLDTISVSVAKALEELPINYVDHVKYCDDAHLKIKKALHDGNPFDLLITDLSFLADTRTANTSLTSGEELIAAVRKLQPDIKILAFSIENRPYRIRSLFDHFGISGFVAKGRNSIPELQKAIAVINRSDTKYISPEFAHVLQGQSINELDTIDMQILRLLSQGNTVEQIAGTFKDNGQMPSSMSSIEKRINKMKVYFSAANSIHLVSLSKDMGMI